MTIRGFRNQGFRIKRINDLKKLVEGFFKGFHNKFPLKKGLA
jgi:hypothetical protein